MPQDFTNRVKFTNEGGTNRILVNGRDIAPEASIEGFSITIDPITARPVMSVVFDVNEIEVDLEGVAVVEEKA
jgi:hypothetical protein